jgi:hypothetical protein
MSSNIGLEPRQPRPLRLSIRLGRFWSLILVVAIRLPATKIDHGYVRRISHRMASIPFSQNHVMFMILLEKYHSCDSKCASIRTTMTTPESARLWERVTFRCDGEASAGFLASPGARCGGILLHAANACYLYCPFCLLFLLISFLAPLLRQQVGCLVLTPQI